MSPHYSLIVSRNAFTIQVLISFMLRLGALIESRYTRSRTLADKITENGTHYFENECGFGELYIKSKTFKQTPNENLNITYADGSFLTGIVGTEQVTLAGITVDSQTVSVVNLAAWEGDGISSGLIGLSFPADTSIYAGTNPTKGASYSNKFCQSQLEKAITEI